jgi:diadenosine tetraphosphate (Ap4A) HIT family hydrolase
MNCPICAWSPEDEDYLFVSDTQYWRVCLAPNQSLPGRCVIHLKRHAGDLTDLTGDEWKDFLNVVKRVEETIRAAFNVTVFN